MLWWSTREHVLKHIDNIESTAPLSMLEVTARFHDYYECVRYTYS